MTFPHGGAASIWADGTGLAYEPKKPEIRAWGGDVETRIAALEATLTGVAKWWADAQADLPGVVALGAVSGDACFVLDDGPDTGVWRYDGSAWARLSGLPPAYIEVLGIARHAHRMDNPHGVTVGQIAGLQAALDALAATDAETRARQKTRIRYDSEGEFLANTVDGNFDYIGTPEAYALYERVNGAAVLRGDDEHQLNRQRAEAEAAARAAADTGLQEQVTAETAARVAAIAAEGTARTAADAALQTAIDNENAGRVAAIAAEGAAREAADAELQTGLDGKAAKVHLHAIADTTGLQAALDRKIAEAELARAQDRPGDWPALFRADLSGAVIEAGQVQAFDGLGLCAVIEGAGRICAAHPVALGVAVTEIRAEVARVVDSTDPAGDAVQLCVRYLDRNRAALSDVVIDTVANPRAASGRVSLAARLSFLPLDGVTAPPAGAVYAVPFVRAFGADGRTAVARLGNADVTNLHGIEGADLSQIIAAAQAATLAANEAAALVATETLPTMGDVSTYARPAGVGVLSLKGGYAAHDGFGGQWAFDAADTTSPADAPRVLVGADGARYKPVRTLFDTVADLLAHDGPQVAAGVVLRTGDGVAYRTAPVAAVDHHATMANGQRLYVVPLADGAYPVDAFGVVADGVADDFAALQRALFLTGYAPLAFGPKTYRTTKTLLCPMGKSLRGAGMSQTILLIDADMSTDGLVLGARPETYADTGALDVAAPALADGFYLVGATYHEVRAGARTGVSTPRDVVTYENGNQTGYSVEAMKIKGHDQAGGSLDFTARHLLYLGGLWRASVRSVWVTNGGGCGIYAHAGLHTEFTGCRTDNTISHGLRLTGDANPQTSTLVQGGYFRQTKDGAGIYTECLGVTLSGVTCEGIGGLGGDTYMPGIWCAGGGGAIVQPYFEDVRGHNVFIEVGNWAVTNGTNMSGAGSLSARDAAVCLTGAARLAVQGAGVADGGGNKVDLLICGPGAVVTGHVTGSPVYHSAVITDPTQYTGADAEAANLSGVQALADPVEGQTAYAQDSAREYVYSGGAWVLTPVNDLTGQLVAPQYGSTDWATFGKAVAHRVGDTNFATIWQRGFYFDAAVDAPGVFEADDQIPANGSVTVSYILPEAIPGYSGGTSGEFQARFSGAYLNNGLWMQVKIVNAGRIDIEIFNNLNVAQGLATTIRGFVIVERYRLIAY